MVGSVSGTTPEKIPSWIERVLLPQLSEMKGAIVALNAQVASTNQKVDSLRSELKSDISRVEATLSTRLSAVEQRLDVVREIDELKSQVALLKAARSRAGAHV